jgi:glutathione reductase (NADPH)
VPIEEAYMERRFDLVVVGTGIASAVASRCRGAGWSVAVVDYRPFGGTCALRGCVPKKVLVSAAEAVHAVRVMAGRGVRAAEIAIDWPELMTVKRGVTDPVPARTEDAWARAGVELFHGRARFVGPSTIAVAEERLVGRHVLIAAGAMPMPLPFAGHEYLATSEQFMELAEMPRRVAFVGGGYISFEFAHVAARAGAQVAILHRGPRPLEAFDADLVDLLVARTREIGIAVELSTEVRGVERSGHGFTVRTGRDGQEQRVEADLVVHGAGRIPELDGLDLEAADVKRDKRGVIVNQYLQSVSNSAVYAAGDAAASGPALTPVASHQVDVVATNLLEGNRRTPNYEGLASAVFTVPPLASAGLTEASARATGLRFRTLWHETSQWLSTRRLGETTSGGKVLVEEGSGRVLGAHLFGPRADEEINVFAVAIRFGIRAEDLKEVLFAYPTVTSDIPHLL